MRVGHGRVYSREMAICKCLCGADMLKSATTHMHCADLQELWHIAVAQGPQQQHILGLFWEISFHQP